MRMMATDEDLARAAANGDGDAFSRLLERQYDRLFSLCFRLTGTRADAEDLCQDICAALPAKLSRFDGRSRVTTWLYRVAVNAAHDRRRKIAVHGRHAQGWGDWETARQAEIAEEAERRDWLTDAIARLGDDLRDTLALVLDDLTHAETADILGVSEGTISWRLSEARRKLRAMREEELSE